MEKDEEGMENPCKEVVEEKEKSLSVKTVRDTIEILLDEIVAKEVREARLDELPVAKNPYLKIEEKTWFVYVYKKWEKIWVLDKEFSRRLPAFKHAYKLKDAGYRAQVNNYRLVAPKNIFGEF